MDGTILQQGKFISDGTRAVIAIRSDVDWMYVYNENAIAQNAADLGAVFYWQRGMTQGRGIVTTKLGATAANNETTIGQLAALSGFTLVNQGTDALVGPAVAFTSTTNAVQPVVATGSTAGLQELDVVRLSQVVGGVDIEPLLGIDFQIDTIVANTSFRIDNALVNAPGSAGGPGFYRKINLSSSFYPETRYIVNITQAVQAVVTTSVRHGYELGQEIRFNIDSSINGMVELDQVVATIVAATNNTFTVDVDTTAMTAFTFPVTTAALANTWTPYTPAFVAPVGANTAFALANNLDTLMDATKNISIIGMQLEAGTLSPAGQIGDVIYWVAGKSYLVDNDGDLVS